LPPQRNLNRFATRTIGTAAENGLPDPTKPVLKAQPVTPADKTPVEEKPVESAAPSQSVRWMKSLPATFETTPPPSLDLGNQ